MRRRVFVAVNLDAMARASISRLVDEIRSGFGPEIRFIPPANLHITLSFLGEQDDGAIGNIVGALQESVRSLHGGSLIFDKLVYGPMNRSPRMIWLLGDREASVELARIKKAIELALEEKNVIFKREERPFSAHITLARLERFSSNNSSSLPTIARNLKIVSEFESIDLMESKLKKSGAEYEIMQKSFLE